MQSDDSKVVSKCGCAGKNPGFEILTHESIDKELETLTTKVWTISTDNKKISREFLAKDWNAAIDFINELSVVAEKIAHHPGRIFVSLFFSIYVLYRFTCWIDDFVIIAL